MKFTQLLIIAVIQLFVALPESLMNFKDAVVKSGPVRTVGWARIHGEMMLFRNETSMAQGDKYPNCISARFGADGPEKLNFYDRKRVEIIGISFDYNSLPDDDAPLLKRKLLDGLTIPNFCFGEKVILLKKVTVSPGVTTKLP